MMSLTKSLAFLLLIVSPFLVMRTVVAEKDPEIKKMSEEMEGKICKAKPEQIDKAAQCDPKGVKLSFAFVILLMMPCFMVY